MKVEQKPVKDLIPYINNPRHNDAAVDAVASSIAEFGFKVPLVIDKNNVIITGHTRLKAAKKLGLETVPVVIADDLTEAQIKAFRLADNKVAEIAEWDEDLLKIELEELADLDFDMGDFGFEYQEEEKSPEDIIEDEPPEPPIEPESKLGDIYQLGNHRVMCGDSTDPEALDKLMNGEKAVFVFTDPPYGVAIGDKNKTLNEANGSHSIERNIEGDTLSKDELHDMLVEAMSNLREHCSSDCSYYVSSPQGGELGLMMMMMMMMEAGLTVRHMLIWVKNTAAFSMGRLDYDYRHEPIFYTWTDKHTFYGDYSTSVIDDTTPIDKMSKAELKDLVRALKREKPDSVIYCDKPVKSELHPTMKPIKLIAQLMINSSRQGDKVLDIFGGSGSTLIAAEQLNRKCYTMEIDPHYVDVIVERWENFTGKKAIKLN